MTNHVVNPSLYSKVNYDPVRDFTPIALPEIVTSLLSGQSQYAFPTLSTALPQVKAGKLRALGVTGAKRNPQLPDVLTMSEAMPPGFELEAWFGLWAPTGTPQDIMRRLNADVDAILNDPQFRARLASDGSEVVSATPGEFAAYVRSESAKWEKVVSDSGARVD